MECASASGAVANDENPGGWTDGWWFAAKSKKLKSGRFLKTALCWTKRRVSVLVMDVRRRFVSAFSLWYPVLLELHRFFVAIARAAVNEDGCTGVPLHPTVWSGGGLVKRRRLVSLLGSSPGSLVPLVLGGMVLLVGLVLRFAMLMLVSGRILLDSW